MIAPPFTLPPRAPDSHKGTFGRVMLVGGSRGMAGSVALSAIASLQTGSGLVSAAVPDRVLETVASFHPAVMTIPLSDTNTGTFGLSAWGVLQSHWKSQSAIGCGPGMTTGVGSIRIVAGLLVQPRLPLVLDADALNILASEQFLADPQYRRTRQDAPLVLTPHPGEFERLSGVAAKQRHQQIEAAKSLVARSGVTLVLKGGPTVVVGLNEDQQVVTWTCPTGNPGMATAGSGDVLTGVITSLLGRAVSGFDAARLGVWLHGLAGDLAAEAFSQPGMTALHLVETLSRVAGRIEA